MNLKSVICTAFFSVVTCFALAGCEGEDSKADRCLDQVVAQCTPVGIKECGLSSSDSDAEFDKCPAYKSCEDYGFDQCMSK